MSFWHEAPYWLREVIAMWGTFLVVVFVICGGAWLSVQRRRK